MNDLIVDPELYRRMCEPFDSKAECEEAATAFAGELRALREKHGLADVVCIIQTPVKQADGTVAHMMLTSNCGDSGKWLMMLAETFGAERERFAGLLASVARRERKP